MPDLTEGQGTWSVPMFSFCSALRNPDQVPTSFTHSLLTSSPLWISRFFASYWYRCTSSPSSLCHGYHSGLQSSLHWSFSLNVQCFASDCSHCSTCVVFGTGQWSQLLVSVHFITVPETLNWGHVSFQCWVTVLDNPIYHLQCPPSLGHQAFHEIRCHTMFPIVVNERWIHTTNGCMPW